MYKDNTFIARANLSLLISDYLFLFLILQRLSEFVPISVASYTLSIKGLGMAVGAILTPFIMRFIGLKKILIGSSLLSSITSILCMATLSNSGSNFVYIFILAFLQAAALQGFSISRESFSKSLGSNLEQRSLQNEILRSAFGAQILGPILSFILINFNRTNEAIVLQIALTITTLLFVSKLSTNEIIKQANTFKPIKYLFSKNNRSLLDIFIIRTILFWIPAAISNYLLFVLLADIFKLKNHFAAILYICTGIGGTAMSIFISRFDRHSFLSKDWKLAFVSLIFLSVIRAFVVFANNFFIATTLFVLSGIALGLNAVTTQTIRRKLCSQDQHPEVMSLEIVVGRLTDWAVGSVAAIAILNGWITASHLYLLSSFLILIFSFALMKKSLRSF